MRHDNEECYRCNEKVTTEDSPDECQSCGEPMSGGYDGVDEDYAERKQMGFTALD